MLCGSIPGKFRDFQNHLSEAQLCRPRQAAKFARYANLSLLLQKAAASSRRKIRQCVQGPKYDEY